MTRRSMVAAATLVAVAATAAAWVLAGPQGSLTSATLRTLADCAGVVTLGLAALPMLDGPRHRAELIGRATAPLAAASAIWVVAELSRLIVAAAETAAVPVGRLGLGTLVDFVTATAAGRSGLWAAAGAAAVCVAAVAVPRSATSNLVVIGLAAVGVAARQVSGHFADSAAGGLAVTVHALAAALWCGALVGLVLTVQHRGQWARMLPRFSQLSLLCVAVLLVGGVIGAAVRLGSPADLYATGYGRVLSAKIVLTVALVALGWRNRTMWVPAARSHRASAVVSRSRSLVETGLMVAALALAAGLAVTG